MSGKNIFYSTIFSLIASNSYGAAQFVQSGSCGSAKAISGDSCGNIEIQFSFDSCKLESAPKKISDITCSEKRITARYTKSNFRYEVVFEKSKDGDKFNWKPEGALSQFVQEEIKPQTKVQEAAFGVDANKNVDEKSEKTVIEEKGKHEAKKEKTKSRLKDTVAIATTKKMTNEKPALTDEQKLAEAIKIVEAAKVAEAARLAKAEEERKHQEAIEAAKANGSASPLQNANPLKWSGFFDARYSNYTIRDSNSSASGNAESGFLIEDGAFYVNYEKDNILFFIDVPFRRLKVGDSNPAANNATVSSNGNVIFGAGNSQIFAKIKWTEALATSFGQFDGPIGLEASDSKDRVFGKTGYLADSMMPTTQVGVSVEYAHSGFSAKAIVANSNNKGSNGDDTKGDNNSEYGLVFGFSNDNFHTQLGGDFKNHTSRR